MALASLTDGAVFSSGFITWSVMLSLAVLLGLVYAAWNIIKPTYRGYKDAKKLDEATGPTQKHWFFGHNKMFSHSHEGILRRSEVTSSHPTMFHHWIAPLVTTLSMHHSDTAMSLLFSGAPKNELMYGFLRPWIGDGLLLSRGAKWQRHRRLLTPAFHFSILKSYAKVANGTVQTMLDKWDQLTDRPLNVSDDVSLMTLDAMLKCAMSSDTDCQRFRDGHPYIKAIKEIAQTITKRMATPYLYPDFIFWKTSLGKQFKLALNVVHAHAEEIIAERRVALASHPMKSDEECDNGGKRKLLDFVDILIQTRDENGDGLTDREIRDEVDTFLFEGHDTTSSGISWALYNLAKHPEMQEKCREEVREILGDEQFITWSDLSKFTYLTMFIKESLRLYPPVFAIGRKLEEPLTVRSTLSRVYETVVPKRFYASLHIFSLHRNEYMWDKPLEFNPERFTKENIAKRSPHAYLPFSAGSRNCIGQNFAMNEMKIALAKTLQRYRLYLDEETPEPVMEPRLILQSKNGIYVKLQSLSP